MTHFLSFAFSKKRSALGLPLARSRWKFFGRTLCRVDINLGYRPGIRERPMAPGWDGHADGPRCETCERLVTLKVLQEMP